MAREAQEPSGGASVPHLGSEPSSPRPALLRAAALLLGENENSPHPPEHLTPLVSFQTYTVDIFSRGLVFYYIDI